VSQLIAWLSRLIEQLMHASEFDYMTNKSRQKLNKHMWSYRSNRERRLGPTVDSPRDTHTSDFYFPNSNCWTIIVCYVILLQRGVPYLALKEGLHIFRSIFHDLVVDFVIISSYLLLNRFNWLSAKHLRKFLFVESTQILSSIFFVRLFCNW